jgi:hypothetical protein
MREKERGRERVWGPLSEKKGFLLLLLLLFTFSVVQVEKPDPADSASHVQILNL